MIEKKINVLDQAAPLAEWDLPPEFATLRRLMEARMIKVGRREYVQVLRLLETFGIIEQVMPRGARHRQVSSGPKRRSPVDRTAS